MNLLFRVLYAQKCTSTHHKLAMDTLRYLRAKNSNDWARLFLSEAQLYLDGSKAPDNKFKDFRNHVLHVSDNFWGGAVPTAELWYGRLVERLKAKDWRRAIYCAGVLGHYVSDPLMPLHTGQTEDEGQVHKFIEWGAAKIYEDLVATHETARALQNWKPPENASAPDWLGSVIVSGAQLSHSHYDIMIDHYDPVLGQKNPSDGFDDTCRASLSMLLGWSIKAMAYILDRAITEAGVQPPKRSLKVSTLLSGLSTPLFWITRKLADRADRHAVQKIWNELQATGKVVHALPEDDNFIRAAHAEEVLGVSIEELDRSSTRKPGTKHGTSEKRENQTETTVKFPPSSTLRFYLELDSPVVDAPSIGPKTARRLNQIEIHTVEQLVEANARGATDRLDERWITVELFTKWQQQSALMCRVPGLRGHDTQLLVEIGITRPEDLSDASAELLLQQTLLLAETSEGERILRSSSPPDLAEVQNWIACASKSRLLHAA